MNEKDIYKDLGIISVNNDYYIIGLDLGKMIWEHSGCMKVPIVLESHQQYMTYFLQHNPAFSHLVSETIAYCAV